MRAYVLYLLSIFLPVIAVPIDHDAAYGFVEVESFSNGLSKRQSLSVTQNQLGLCRPVTVIFARGTIELGNVGSLVGPPFFNALGATIGANNLGVQGVEYPATILGYLKGGDKGGATKLAALTEQAAIQCPDTQIVLSGYSQGAQVVHLGAAQISASTAARVAAVVLFGDPFDGQPLPNIDGSKVDTFCFSADLICKDTIVVDVYHLAYSIDAVPAAQFVKSKVHL